MPLERVPLFFRVNVSPPFQPVGVNVNCASLSAGSVTFLTINSAFLVFTIVHTAFCPALRVTAVLLSDMLPAVQDQLVPLSKPSGPALSDRLYFTSA